MVEVVGELLNTDVQESMIKDEWSLPAMTKGQATLEARINSRAKGRNSPEVVSVVKSGDGEIPGQSIYKAVVESKR